MKYSIFATLMVGAGAENRSVKDTIRNRHMEKVDDMHRSPVVGHAECQTSVERLKAGPVDIDTVL